MSLQTAFICLDRQTIPMLLIRRVLWCVRDTSAAVFAGGHACGCLVDGHAAGSVRIHLVTTSWRALARASSPDEQKSSSGSGAESPVKSLVRKGMWCPNNGSHTPSRRFR